MEEEALAEVFEGGVLLAVPGWIEEGVGCGACGLADQDEVGEGGEAGLGVAVAIPVGVEEGVGGEAPGGAGGEVVGDGVGEGGGLGVAFEVPGGVEEAGLADGGGLVGRSHGPVMVASG